MTYTLKVDTTYVRNGKVLVGYSAMGLVFNESLEVQKADIIVNGARGGGFNRPVDKSQLGSFVAEIMFHVLNELSELSYSSQAKITIPH